MTLYNAVDFDEFVSTENPYPLFLKHNSIKITQEHKDKYFELCKPPSDWEGLVEDI